MSSPEDEISKQRQNDPDNWKCEYFYFNRQDPRIFVPKKSGYGVTPNFANPKSIIVLVTLFIAWILIAIAWLKQPGNR